MNSTKDISAEEKLAYLELLKAKKKRVLELKRQEQALKEEEDALQRKLVKSERANKILYIGHDGKEYLGDYKKWELNDLQEQLIKAFQNSKYKVFTYTGANRIGKTFITFILLYSCLIGRFPWEDEKKSGWLWDLFGWKPPIKIRWVGQDWERHIKTVLVPKIKELWPASHPLEVRKNNNGVSAYWCEQKMYGTIEIMSNNQDAALFEGWNGHAIAYDEPPKRENRVACARGLIDFNGKEIFAMTLLKEAWVHQEVINGTLEDGSPDPTIFNVNGEISANVGYGITEEGIKQFSKVLTEEERDARLRGIPAYLSGKVLNLNRNKHVIERINPIPPTWPVDIAVDIGISKPHDILYLATSPRGFKYACFEEQVRGDGIAIGEALLHKIQTYNLRVNIILCDPLAKSDSNMENTTWNDIDNVIGRAGYYLELGSKHKDDGILRINELLSSEFGEPSLYFFRDMQRTIKQCDGWMRDDDGTVKKYRANQLPGDDQCENLYRLALLGTAYEESHSPPAKIKDYSGVNKYTGY